MPEDDDELHAFVQAIFNVTIPRLRVCPTHCAPFEAFADAYFARTPVSVWKASRGLGGKSFLLALLAVMEMVGQGATVTVLGGSGAQSQNVNSYTWTLWNAPLAPRQLLASDPGRHLTRLTNGGAMSVLLASQRSVRGPHPARLRLDEADEMAWPILTAALGQPMESPAGVAAQTVISSTHQHPDGTMSKVLKLAVEKSWRKYEWCYQESAQPHGWLSWAEITRKQSEVTKATWDIEFDMQEPSAEGRIFTTAHIAQAFDPALGSGTGLVGEYLEFEPPSVLVPYVTGIDWGRKAHWTVILTYRVDQVPWRLVAFERLGREEWPAIVARANIRLRRYAGRAAHDGAGVGDVVDGFLTERAESLIVGSGAARDEFFNALVLGGQHGKLVHPDIAFMRDEWRYCTRDALYGAGHPPDSLVAAALAWSQRGPLVASIGMPMAHAGRVAHLGPGVH